MTPHERREKNARRAREYRKRCRERGQCVECTAKAVEGSIRCQHHLERARERAKGLRRERRGTGVKNLWVSELDIELLAHALFSYADRKPTRGKRGVRGSGHIGGEVAWETIAKVSDLGVEYTTRHPDWLRNKRRLDAIDALLERLGYEPLETA